MNLAPGSPHAEAALLSDDGDASVPTDARGTDLLRRLRVSAVLTVPVLLLSTIPALQLPGRQWVVTALALPVATWAAWPFHRAAARAARHGAATTDTLVSTGIIAATGWSLWALPELSLEVAAVLTTVLLAGRYAEHRSRRRAGDALRTLLDLEGSGAVDASLLTGEPVPVDVAPGSDVQRLVDRVSTVLVPIVLVLAVATPVAWLVSGAGAQPAFTAAVAVLIIACPRALALAAPIALLVGTGRGAQLGVLVKGPHVLGQTRQVDTVVLDTTGTVTAGRMRVDDVLAVEGTTPEEVLAVAGAVEGLSEHPIARAIVAAAAERLPGSTEGGGEEIRVGGDGVVVGSAQVLDFHDEAGSGVSGVVRTAHSGLGLGRRVLVGRPAWLRAEGTTVETGLAARGAAAEAQGGTAVMVAWNGVARGVVVLRDPVEATDLTLVRGDLRSAGQAIRLSRATLRVIRQNLFWASAYNVAAIPLAALGLVDPMIAGAATAFSSFLVVANSLRLRRFA
ncbi:HAD family hydrolase [Cellulomonas fimi]|uniref:heavy metal translocating P-type ATPase n=1 Tax=Cellulomonas fimi TaxID=1708 RepID=UPI002892B258|nr:HAD family hydrolase [Cellulomonas fimi]